MPCKVKPAIIEERILELVTQAIKAATLTQETYTMKHETTSDPNQGMFRSNTWCGKCHGYGHLASECPTVSRVFVDRPPPRQFCTFCSRPNHTEEQCYHKRAYEERTLQSENTQRRPYTGLPAQSIPPIPRWETRQTYGHGAQGQEGGYLGRAAHAQGRGTGPIQCWRCHGLDILKLDAQMKINPLVTLQCAGTAVERATLTKTVQKRKPTAPKHREVEEQVQELVEQREIEDGDKVEILPRVTKKFMPDIAPFPERLKTTKCRKERKSTEEIDIVQMLAKIEVTMDIGTLLRCSPTYRKQFYNEYIKKPRKAQDKKRQEKDVQGFIQSITTQIDSNAPSVVVEIKGYAVPGAQFHSGAAVNLMTEYMMKALGLTHMEETPMSLRMADQTQVKPVGLLKNVSTVVGGLEFSVDYLIVRPRTSEATFSILLGRPWLVQTTEEELEKKTKEKAKQEKARVRFALNTEPYKKLLVGSSQRHRRRESM
ncbi:hypothetical protein KP509_08G004300 [Ceratopteris richardii]|uniref:CCHC-type domain-containing protein n=1 Tax=Ceratopteris richardii TaxID=49495 RepID=A0A8T2U338_CERRI|nr:hypothetical protein KP509_08G004300 [Ceratopteris richardii]